MRSKLRLNVILLVALGLVPAIANEARAIIGMPATPMSYAGVARRTVRRSYYY